MSNERALHEDSHNHHDPNSTRKDERSPDPATSPSLLPNPLICDQERERDQTRPLSSHLAIRSDAVVLLSTEDLAGCDLTGRKQWTGIELTPAEVVDVRGRFSGAAEEAAAHLAGKLRKKKGGGS
jgi:hypothetical protein